MAAEARAALDGALLAQRTRRPGIPLGEEAYLATMVLQWTACEEGFSLLLRGGLLSVAARSRLDLERVTDAETRPSQVVGRPSVFGGAEAPAWGWEPVDGSLQPFQLTVRSGAVRLMGRCLCGSSLQGGLGCLLRGWTWRVAGWSAGLPLRLTLARW